MYKRSKVEKLNSYMKASLKTVALKKKKNGLSFLKNVIHTPPLSGPRSEKNP